MQDVAGSVGCGTLEAHQRAAVVRRQELDRAAEQLRPLAHRHQAEAPPRAVRLEARAVILDLELESGRIAPQPDPGLVSLRMPRHVVQRLLQHAVDVDRRSCRPPRPPGRLRS